MIKFTSPCGLPLHLPGGNIEGEIYHIAMCVAAAGQGAVGGVLIAGALGGATGDQFWFYLLRGRIHWLDRYPGWPATATPSCIASKTIRT
jgi:hypothetical protein